MPTPAFYLRTVQRLVLLTLAWGAALAHAAYIANGDGTVTDTDTGLVWEQCAQGQYSSASRCDTGHALTITWAAALALVTARNLDQHLGHNDWRLPNKNELESIVNLNASNPAIDTTAFPNTPTGGYFWSSTSYAPDNINTAWGVYFYKGTPWPIKKSDTNRVRLVRGGSSAAGFDAQASAHPDGTQPAPVTDPATGLVWDRCTLGQFSASGICDAGHATLLSWDAALAEVSARNFDKHLGYSDWRLPNKNELESIVNLNASNPAIDAAAFPNTPANGYFWTGTSYAPDNINQAWGVYFYKGTPWTLAKADANRVRLVRGGQAMAEFDALAVNGRCGSAHGASLLTSAPSSGSLCASGTAGSLRAGAQAYTWVCTGAGGGTASGECSAGRGYTVTPRVEADAGHGGISPAAQQVVAYQATPSFTVAPQAGYTATVDGSCGGTVEGSLYTTLPVSADCTVTARFDPYTVYTGTAPGGGTVSTSLGAAAGCAFATAGYQEAAAVGSNLPEGYVFPQGVLAFTTNNGCGSGVTVTLTYPNALPPDAKFFKYGPASAGASPTWYEHPATLRGNTVTYTIADNGPGDSDATVGVIRDPGGVGVPRVSTIPALGHQALALLASLLLLAGVRAASGPRRAVPRKQAVRQNTPHAARPLGR